VRKRSASPNQKKASKAEKTKLQGLLKNESPTQNVLYEERGRRGELPRRQTSRRKRCPLNEDRKI